MKTFTIGVPISEEDTRDILNGTEFNWVFTTEEDKEIQIKVIITRED